MAGPIDDGRRDAARAGPRFIAFGLSALVLFAALGGRLFQLQVLDGQAYALRAAAVRTVEVPIPAPRGRLFDRTGRPLAINVPSWTVSIRPADLPDADRGRILRQLARVTGLDWRRLEQRLDAYVGSPYDAVPVVRGVPREAALILAEVRDATPGVVVTVEAERRYLGSDGQQDGSLLAHVLGYTGPVSREQLDTLAAEGYLHNDRIGMAGIEASNEAELRGAYGMQRVERDAAGRLGRTVALVRPPQAGTNLMLTLDVEMQRQATQALGWGMEVADVSQGVVIAMNPQSGEILAMVSLPTYDSNKFAAGIGVEDYAAYLADADKPLRNHAISDIFPPGSTFKLVTALAALEEGVTTATRRWPTYGCYQIPGAAPGECLYDWNRSGFGPLDVVEAFAKSSDTFFYQMAIRVGIDPLARWAGELGFGRLTGIGLPGEEPGIVASTDWARRQGRPGVYTGEVAQAGIGQSVVAVTPLQVLNAYAALANGGRLMRPMVVRGEADHDGRLVRAREPEEIGRVDADPDHLRTLRIGAREVISTGHAYNIRDLDLPGALSGKTGTAEFGQPTAEGTLPFHSWFVAYLPGEAGATDAELAVIAFSHSAVVPGNVSAEVVKYFLQLHFGLDQDLRLNPNDFSLVTAN